MNETRSQALHCTSRHGITHEDGRSPLVGDDLLLGDMQVLVTCREGLELVNFLVRGTAAQDKIIAWKIKHLPQHSEEHDDDEGPLLGQKYWSNFCQ